MTITVAAIALVISVFAISALFDGESDAIFRENDATRTSGVEETAYGGIVDLHTHDKGKGELQAHTHEELHAHVHDERKGELYSTTARKDEEELHAAHEGESDSTPRTLKEHFDACKEKFKNNSEAVWNGNGGFEPLSSTEVEAVERVVFFVGYQRSGTASLAVC